MPALLLYRLFIVAKITLLLFLSINFSHAKNNDTIINSNKNELYASYGLFSFSSIFIGYRIVDSDFPSDYITNKNNYSKKLTEIPPVLGTLNFGYKRYIKNKFGILMNITYSQINGSFQNKISDTLSFKTKDNIVAILPGFEYHYFNRKIVQLYSGIQLGVYVKNKKLIDNRQTIKQKNVGFAFQVDALGVRVGKKIGGFVEIGFGFNGIVKVGISGQF